VLFRLNGEVLRTRVGDLTTRERISDVSWYTLAVSYVISGQAVRVYSAQTHTGIDAPVVRAHLVRSAIVVDWNVTRGF